MFFQKIRFWYKNARPIALPQSVFPAIIAIAMASHKEHFSIVLSLLALAGIILAHLGSNLFDDYFDYRKSKTDLREKLKHEGFRARIAKCPYLTSNQTTEKELLTVASIFFLMGLAISIIILLFRGEVILYFMLATLVLGLSYSSKPLKLSYRGFGELQIGFMFGPLLMSGVYFSACGEFNPALLFIFTPIGFLVMNIIYVHAILDQVPDKHVGKMTLAVKINNQMTNIFILAVINLLPFILIVAGVSLGLVSPYFLLTLTMLPLSLSLIYIMYKYIKEPDKKVNSKFLFGYSKDWEQIKKLGNDWFMVRWLLARNLTTYFSLIVFILSLIIK